MKKKKVSNFTIVKKKLMKFIFKDTKNIPRPKLENEVINKVNRW